MQIEKIYTRSILSSRTNYSLRWKSTTRIRHCLRHEIEPNNLRHLDPPVGYPFWQGKGLWAPKDQFSQNAGTNQVFSVATHQSFQYLELYSFRRTLGHFTVRTPSGSRCTMRSWCKEGKGVIRLDLPVPSLIRLTYRSLNVRGDEAPQCRAIPITREQLSSKSCTIPDLTAANSKPGRSI